jgi:hypothetical protein
MGKKQTHSFYAAHYFHERMPENYYGVFTFHNLFLIAKLDCHGNIISYQYKV